MPDTFTSAPGPPGNVCTMLALPPVAPFPKPPPPAPTPDGWAIVEPPTPPMPPPPPPCACDELTIGELPPVAWLPRKERLVSVRLGALRPEAPTEPSKAE